MSGHTRFLVLSLILSLGLASLAEATPDGRISLSTPGGQQSWWDSFPPIEFSQSFSGTIYGLASGSVSSPAGMLGAYASVSTGIAASQSSARTHFFDEFTLLGPPEGTPVDLDVDLSLNGTLTVNMVGGAAWVAADVRHFESAPSFFTTVSDPGAILAVSIFADSQMVHQTGSRTFAFVAGQAFGLAFELDVLAKKDAVSDFAGTLGLSFVLPAGTSIQSTGGYSQVADPDPASHGDFDGDGDVDGLDFLYWQRNPGIGNLADWQANYGVPLSSVASTVPEPASMLLALIGVLGAVGRRC